MVKTAVCPPGIMNKIGVRLDRIHSVALLVGDPPWLDELASLCTRHEAFSQYKALRSMEVDFGGQTFLALSYGYGATNLQRALNELGLFGVRCVLLITNSFSLVPGRVAPRAMCVTYASCRGERCSTTEVDLSYPAVAHPDAVRALRRACGDLGFPARLTRSFTCDSEYPSKLKRAPGLRAEILQTDFELEDRDTSTFLVTCGIRRLVAGVISCNETEPCEFDPVTGAAVEDAAVVESRRNVMRIALHAATKLAEVYE